jgi:ABC-type multidrug transport system fused ATPase/permease subunit
LLELEKHRPMVIDNGKRTGDGNGRPHLNFSNVSFRFSNDGRKIIDDLSVEIKPGQTVALVGKVGSGKSSIAGMIPRYVDPTEGSITLDGHDIREYELKELRNLMGYVPQEPVLFGTQESDGLCAAGTGVVFRYD